MVKIWNCPYKDGLAAIMVEYQNTPNIKELMFKCPSIMSPIEAFYQVAVNYKELRPIEEINQEEKLRIWKLTEGLNERVKASRAIYLMETILYTNKQ